MFFNLRVLTKKVSSDRQFPATDRKFPATDVENIHK